MLAGISEASGNIMAIGATDEEVWDKIRSIGEWWEGGLRIMTITDRLAAHVDEHGGADLRLIVVDGVLDLYVYEEGE